MSKNVKIKVYKMIVLYGYEIAADIRGRVRTEGVSEQIAVENVQAEKS